MIPRRRFVGGMVLGAGAAAVPISLFDPTARAAYAEAAWGPVWSRGFDDQRTGRAVLPWVAGGTVLARVGSPVDNGMEFVQAYAPDDGRMLYRHVIGGDISWGQDDRSLYMYDRTKGTLSSYDITDDARSWRVGIEYVPTEVTGGGGRTIAVERNPSQNNGFLTAHDDADGKQLWRTSLTSAGFARPLVTTSAVFVAYAGGALERYNAENGSLVWRTGSPPSAVAGRALPELVEHDGRLYHFQVSSTRVYDVSSGDLVDTVALDKLPVFDGSLGFFLIDGKVSAKRTDGSVAWTYAPALGAVSISNGAGGRIAVVTADETVSLLNTSTGDVLWTVISPDSAEDDGVVPAAAVGDGFVAVSWAGQALEAYPTSPRPLTRQSS